MSGKRIYRRANQKDYQSRWAAKKIQEPMWATMAERFRNGEQCRTLASDYKQPLDLVRSVLYNAGVRRHAGPKAQEAIRLYEGGCSYEEIGRLLGCRRQNIHSLLVGRVESRTAHSNGRPGWPEMIARGEW